MSDIDSALHNLVLASRVDPWLRSQVQIVENHIRETRSRGGDRARMGCPDCADYNDLGGDPPVMRCIVCGTGYWDEADQ